MAFSNRVTQALGVEVPILFAGDPRVIDLVVEEKIEVSTMVLVPLVAQRCGLPVIAAGGVVDGRSLAAAFCLGAEGAQMGTRMLASAESAVHDNLKQAVVDATETDTFRRTLAEFDDVIGGLPR